MKALKAGLIFFLLVAMPPKVALRPQVTAPSPTRFAGVQPADSYIPPETMPRGSFAVEGTDVPDDRGVIAKDGDSSCVDCHETRGLNPVAQSGAWHRQHAQANLCAGCHGGHPQAATMGAAHEGLQVNPLEDTRGRCGACHPGDASLRAESYLEEAKTQKPLPFPSGAAQGGWLAVLRFARGPLFNACCIFFAAGMLLRLLQAIWRGWKCPPRALTTARLPGVALSFLKALLIFPFLPTLKGNLRRWPVAYVAGGCFHLGLLATVLLSQAHVWAWKSVLGFGWPALPRAMISGLAALAILGMVALLALRLVEPVLRLISGPAEWMNWAVVFLPLATGFVLARGFTSRYEVAFAIHMLLVDFLLVWIPLSRISHFMFYFISRAVHGMEFGPESPSTGTSL